MEKWKEKLLLDLNSISRVAVLEQAYLVETMLRNYTKILKYRWAYEQKNVTVNMELIHLQMLLEYYQVKWASQLNFKISVMSDTDTKAVMIPHFSFCSVIINCLEKLQEKEPILKIEILVSTMGDELIIKILLAGDIDVKELKHNILSKESSEYDTFYETQIRWKKMFGVNSLLLEEEEKSGFIIQFVVTGAISK